MPSVAPDQHGRQQVRQDVAREDAQRAGAERARGLDEVLLHQRAGLGVDHPGDLDPVHHRDHQRHDPQGRAEDGGERDRQQQRRKRHHQVGKAHDAGADPAAEIARDDAEQRADQHRDAIGDDADDQRGARAEDQAREQVAPQEVGAEPEARVRRQRRALERQAVEELLARRIGCELRRQQRRERHQDDHGEAEQGCMVAQQGPQNVRHRRAGLPPTGSSKRPDPTIPGCHDPGRWPSLVAQPWPPCSHRSGTS